MNRIFFLGIGLMLMPSVALAMMPLSVFKGVPEAAHLWHRVAIIGEESGRVVSNDPNTLEAQIAEANGYGLICGKDIGTLNIVEHKGRKFLVGAAHAFYKNGRLRCNKTFGKFFPDDHYDNNPNINHKKSYAFELPPLNDEVALKIRSKNISNKSLRDFVVLEIKDKLLYTRQTRGTRKFVKMFKASTSDLPILSKNKNIYLISGRANFHNYKKVSFQEECQLKRPPRGLKLLRHNCDTGDGSSGSSLSFLGLNGDLYSVGIHIAGTSTTDREFTQAAQSKKGNFFIPSKYVIKALDEALIELTRRENARPLAEFPFTMPYGKSTLATSKNWRQVQTVLAHQNFYRGKIDGKLGPKTSRALYNYLRPLMEPLKQSATLAGKRANSKLKQNDKSTQGFGYNQHTDSNEIDVVTKGQWKTQNGKKVFSGYYTTAYREGDWNTVCYHYRKISADNLHAKLCLTPKLKIGYHTRFSINLFNKKIVILGSSTGTEMELQSRKGKDKHLLSLKEKFPLPNQVEFIRAATLPVAGDLPQLPK